MFEARKCHEQILYLKNHFGHKVGGGGERLKAGDGRSSFRKKSKAFMEAMQGGGAVYWGQRGGKTVQWKAVQWGAVQWEAVQWWGARE